MPDTVARSKAAHVLTWLQDEIVSKRVRLILPERHIRFHIHDISMLRAAVPPPVPLYYHRKIATIQP